MIQRQQIVEQKDVFQANAKKLEENLSANKVSRDFCCSF